MHRVAGPDQEPVPLRQLPGPQEALGTGEEVVRHAQLAHDHRLIRESFDLHGYFPNISPIASGPKMMMKMHGKMKTTVGKSSLSVAF
ncbi:hypothetical protein D3C78_1737000 [compost metagenome]